MMQHILSQKTINLILIILINICLFSCFKNVKTESVKLSFNDGFENFKAREIKNFENINKDLYLEANINQNKTLDIRVYNNKDSVKYLFSKFIEDKYLYAPFTQRIDTINNIVKIILTPVFDNPMKEYHANIFYFIKMDKGTTFQFSISLDKYSDKSFSNISKAIIELGFYDNVDLLCLRDFRSDDSVFWRTYNSQKYSYKIISSDTISW